MDDNGQNSQLDFSTFKPVNSSQPQPSNDLDFSTFKPANQEPSMYDKMEGVANVVDQFPIGGHAAADAMRTGIGFVKGGQDLLHGIGTLAQKGSILPDDMKAQRINPPAEAPATQGAMEKVGYGGESLLEFLATDGALAELSMGEKLKTVSNIVGALEKSPKLMTALKIGTTALKSGSAAAMQQYVHSGGDITEALKSGGMMAGVAAAFHVPVAIFEEALRKSGAEGLTLLSDYMKETPNAVRPMEKEIAGVKVPVAVPQTNPNIQTIRGKVASKLASAEGAEKFIQEQVQPKATEAVNANFAKAAEDSIHDARVARGEESAVGESDIEQARRRAPMSPSGPEVKAKSIPSMNTVDDIVTNLRKEAKVTYSKLDEAVKPDIEEWQKAKDAFDVSNPKPEKPSTNSASSVSSASKPTKLQNDAAKLKYQNDLKNWQNANDEWEQENPQPKTFTQLQDQITQAQKTIDSKFSSQVDKQTAINALPAYQDEMQEYIHRYGDVVMPGELASANKLWSQSYQYDWISDRVRTATRGTNSANSVLKLKNIQLRPASLESIPASFDNKFGAGSFEKLIGFDGVKNYNEIISLLRNPVTKGANLQNFIQNHFMSEFAKKPVSWAVDHLLFDPALGQKFINALKTYQAGLESTAGKSAQYGLSKVLKGAYSPLGGNNE